MRRAFTAHNTWQTFLVGIAGSIGAGISMAFAEALSDDGSLTGHGAPLLRGAVRGAMTQTRRKALPPSVSLRVRDLSHISVYVFSPGE